MEITGWGNAYWQSALHYWPSGDRGRRVNLRRALCGSLAAERDIDQDATRAQRCRNCTRILQRDATAPTVELLHPRLVELLANDPAALARARAAAREVKAKIRSGSL